jgi:hypothetical protein
MLLRLHDRGQQGRVVTTPSPEADLAVTEQFRRAGHRPRMAGIPADGNRLTRTIAGDILCHAAVSRLDQPPGAAVQNRQEAQRGTQMPIEIVDAPIRRRNP